MQIEIQTIKGVDPEITIAAEIVYRHGKPHKLRRRFRVRDREWSAWYWHKWDCVAAAKRALRACQSAPRIRQLGVVT